MNIVESQAASRMLSRKRPWIRLLCRRPRNPGPKLPGPGSACDHWEAELRASVQLRHDRNGHGTEAR